MLVNAGVRSPAAAPGSPQLWKIDCACYIFLKISSIYYICPKMCYSKGKFVHNEMSFVYAVLNTKVCTTCKISQTLNCPVKKFSA